MVAYDAAGGVLCAGVNNNTIKLFDVRNLDKGPFVNFSMKRKQTSQWTNVKFSPCGTYILASALDGAIFLLDAFNGNVVRQYAGHLNTKLTPMETGFSPDSKFVLAGSEDGSVYIWDTKVGSPPSRTHFLSNFIKFRLFFPHFLPFLAV